MVELILRERRGCEAFHALDDGGVPIEVVDEYFCRNLFDDPEARRLNLVSETWSTSVGRFEDPGLLVNITPAETIVQRGPCACGEQSREILLELGYSSSDIDAMVEESCRIWTGPHDRIWGELSDPPRSSPRTTTHSGTPLVSIDLWRRDAGDVAGSVTPRVRCVRIATHSTSRSWTWPAKAWCTAT